MTVEAARHVAATASPADMGRRLDVWLAARLPELSRTRIKTLIDEGHVQVDGVACKASHRLKPGEHVQAIVPPPPSDEMAAVLRLAGGAVLAIGLCCGLGLLSESGSSRGRPLDLVPGLVVYYGCAVAILADAIMRRVQAPLLWPAMLVHAALLVWCVVCLASERTVRR